MRKTLLTTASGVALLFGAGGAVAQSEAPNQTSIVAQMERERSPQAAPDTGAAQQRDRPAATKGATGAQSTETFLSYDQNKEKFAGKTVGNLPAEEWIGRDIVNQQGDTIGSVEDLLIKDQEITHALVEVGGFLGIGATRVALEVDQLRPAEGADGDLVSNMTRDQLEAKTHLERTNGSWAPSEARDQRGLTR